MFAWGNNNQGQFGIGSTVDQYTPVPVEGLTDVKQVFAGNDFSMALKHDCTLWAWGNNGMGQLGDNSNIDRTRPVQVSGINDVVQVSLSDNHSLAVKNDNTVWAWGSNTYNVLGLPSGTYHTPTQVKGVDGIGFLTDVIQVSAGSSHSMALKSNGDVYSPIFCPLAHTIIPFLPNPMARSGLVGITIMGHWAIIH
jgi:alpha-tubulin suppressor-like RCC1 family protein